MRLWSDAINHLGSIDSRYTCDLGNSSPELRWDEVPDRTRSFAMTVEDPEAPKGTFIHWVIYRIPADLRHLPAGIPPQDTLPNGITQGLNSAQKLGYLGPCPPVNDPAHRYIFRLWALSELPELPPRLSAQQLMERIESHVIGMGEFTAYYRRAAQRAG